MPGYIFVSKLKIRQVFNYRILPVQLPLFHQHGQRRTGKRLAVGSNIEERVFVYRIWIAQLLHAIAFRKDYFAVLHDPETDTRNIKFFQNPMNISIQSRWNGGLLRKNHRDRHQEDESKTT